MHGTIQEQVYKVAELKSGTTILRVKKVVFLWDNMSTCEE